MNLEQVKYNLIESSLEDDLIHTRWSIPKLKKYLNKKYGINSIKKVDKSGLTADYSLIGAINKHWGYVDIYYLKIPYDKSGSGNTIYITEVGISDE